MTALAQKLRSAGVDTIGARLTNACIEALRVHPTSLAQAWSHVGDAFGHDLLKGLIKDMGLPEIKEGRPAVVQPLRQKAVQPARLERREKLREVIRSKYSNSAGVSWSEVGWHELTALSRDGDEAKALLQAGPASVPNDGRTVGQVLGIKRVDQIIKAARGS